VESHALAHSDLYGSDCFAVQLWSLTPLRMNVMLLAYLPALFLLSPEVARALQSQTGNNESTHVLYTQSRKHAGIAIVAHTKAQKLYAEHIKSVRNYAREHHYNLHVVDPTRSQFQKGCGSADHMSTCVVKEFIKAMPAGYSLVVMGVDADGHGFLNKVERTGSMLHQLDVSLYMRCGVDELTAGDYIVRNTPLGRKFLEEWSGLEEWTKLNQAPGSISTRDNGALHLLVVNTLLEAGEIPEANLEDAKQCNAKYHNSTSDGSGMDPHIDFVKTCTRALGNPKIWTLSPSNSYAAPGTSRSEAAQASSGSIAIWPPFFGGSCA